MNVAGARYESRLRHGAIANERTDGSDATALQAALNVRRRDRCGSRR